jgi:hypothetical protein
LKRKLEELEEMKRKIARIETRKMKSSTTAQAARVAGGDSSAPSSQLDSGSATPVAKAIQSSAVAQSNSSTTAGVTSKPATPVATPARLKAAEQEKETLRRRLLELEAQGIHLPPATRALAEPSITETNAPDKNAAQNEVEMDDGEVEDSDFYEAELSDANSSADVPAVVHTTSTDEIAKNLEAQSVGGQNTPAGELKLASNPALDTESLDETAQDEGLNVDPVIPADTAANATTPEPYDDDDDMDDVYEPQPESNQSPTIDTAPAGSAGADDAGAEVLPEDGGASTSASVLQPVDANDDVDDDDEEDYEPSQDVGMEDAVAAQSPTSTDAMSESVSMSESEEASSEDTSAARSPGDNLVADLSPVPEEHFGSNVSADVQIIDDGLAPELQPSPEQHVVAGQQPQAESGSYKPYESPLSRFKDFRFHPSFLTTVPGGHKSLTFTHNIDPVKQVCPYELGGRCNDKDCPFQHFEQSEFILSIIFKIPLTHFIRSSGSQWYVGYTSQLPIPASSTKTSFHTRVALPRVVGRATIRPCPVALALLSSSHRHLQRYTDSE